MISQLAVALLAVLLTVVLTVSLGLAVVVWWVRHSDWPEPAPDDEETPRGLHPIDYYYETWKRR